MQYPSPSDGPEAQYYHIPTTREQQLQEQQQSQEHQQLQQHQQSQEQQHDDEHHNLHELQELQDEPAQHHNSTVVSVDELQLAAQLTQGLTQDLAPMLAAAQQREMEQEAMLQSQEDVEMQNQGDANLEQLQAQLQNHVQNHEQMQSRENKLEEVLAHADQSQVQHLYGQNTPQPQHGQSLTPIDGLPHSPYALIDANTPPRKRSKVSRACDECRRKKIKCDAQSEPGGGPPCSNCKRAAAQCLFSRVPQKRGPSKGYIKELADRIHNIEGKFGISKEDSVRRSVENYASPTPVDEARKRPYSSISGDAFSVQSPGRQPPWVPEHKPIRPYQPDSRLPPWSLNDLAPKPETPTPLFSGPIENIPQARPEGMEGIAENGPVQGGLPQTEQIPEIDDVRFDCYMNIVHRTLPVLASSKERVQLVLAQCPPTLKNAFMNAFFALLKPFLRDATHSEFGSSFVANQLLLEWESERPHTSSQATDLVHLQTLIIMIIEADYHGLASIKGQAAGPPKSYILPRAVGVGIAMKLYLAQIDPNPGPDPEEDGNVAIRAWWTLIMLDRWNAMGTASLSLVSNDSVVVVPGLRHVVGDVVFLFIKISYYLGLFTPLGIRPSLDPFGDSPPITGSFGNSIAESVRWQFPADLDEVREPALHLAYWHFRLLAQLFSSHWSPDLALQCCRNMVRLLLGNASMINPLTHHFVSLCSLVLMELTKVDNINIRDEATKLAKNLVEFSVAPSPWNNVVLNTLAKKIAVPQLDKETGQRGTSQNLQQLADVAATVDGTGPINSEAPAPQEQDSAPIPAADTGDENLKEELLQSIKGLEEATETSAPPPARLPTEEPSTHNSNDNNASFPELQGKEREPLDPQTILRGGYLTLFDALDEQFSQPQSTTSPS
ncbi:hypothetical protein V8F20_002353 [Naviculisporaceae sp. PSN 640]